MRLKAFALFLLILLLSCTQVHDPLTGKKVFTILPPEEEIAIGNKLLPQSITQFEGQYPDKAVRKYAEKIGLLISERTPRKLPYGFYIANSSVVNAFALPGGKIVITRGIFLLFDKECELAGVLGHELGHVNARHHARFLEKQMGLSLLLQIGALLLGGETLTERAILRLAEIGANLLALKFSRDQEREADKLGVRFTAKAGYDPRCMIDVFRKLRAKEKERPPEWLSTHPLPESRIREIAELIRKLRIPTNLKRNSEEFKRIKERLLRHEKSFKLYEEGKKLFFKKRVKEALRKFEEAIKLYPDNQIARAYAAYIYVREGKPQKALKYAERVVKIDPLLLWGWYVKGIALFELKRYEESIRTLNRARELVGTYGGIYYYLGRNYEALGLIREAIKNYRMAVKLATGKEDWYWDARKRLAKYGVIF